MSAKTEIDALLAEINARYESCNEIQGTCETAERRSYYEGCLWSFALVKARLQALSESLGADQPWPAPTDATWGHHDHPMVYCAPTEHVWRSSFGDGPWCKFCGMEKGR